MQPLSTDYFFHMLKRQVFRYNIRFWEFIFYLKACLSTLNKIIFPVSELYFQKALDKPSHLWYNNTVK